MTGSLASLMLVMSTWHRGAGRTLQERALVCTAGPWVAYLDGEPPDHARLITN